MNQELPIDPQDFAAYYRFAPAALAIRECVRLRVVRELELEEPILDVGCGDGLFAKLAYPSKQSWGIDINPSEVQRAQRTASYSTLICGNICDVQLPQNFFRGAVANCSLEHVPDIDGALSNIRSSMVSGTTFAMIVPTPDWDRHLATAQALDKLGLESLARSYGAGLNRVFRHIHLYDEARWGTILKRAGFEVEQCRRFALAESSVAYDLMLYPSFLGFLTKKLTGHWVLAPPLRAFSVDLVRRLVDGIGSATTPDPNKAAEFLFVCRAVEPSGEDDSVHGSY